MKKTTFLTLLVLSSILTFAQDSTDFKQLNEVIVNATRAHKNSGMAITNVSKKAIERVNLGQDIPTLLNLQPSVVTTSDAGAGIGYSGIRIRGSDATRINVTINGIPYNDSESQGVYWVNMPDLSSSVQSIQIQRGVGTSSNGAGAFGASINVNTLGYSKTPFGEINSTVGSFGTQKINFMTSTGLLNDHWVVDARISSIASNGYIDNSAANLKSYYASVGYYNNSNFVRFNSFSGKEITHQAWEGIPQAVANNDLNGIRDYVDRNYLGEDYYATLIDRGRKFNPYTYQNQVDNYKQDHYQLISSFLLKNNWRLSPSLHYTRGLGYFEQYKTGQDYADYGFNNPSENITETDLVRRKWLDNHFYGMVWSLESPSTNKHALVFGGGANNYVGDHYGDIIWAANSETIPKDSRWYNNLGEKSDINLYAKDQISWTKDFQTYVDLQVRNVALNIDGTNDNLALIQEKENFFFVNPKVGFNYNFGQSSSLYGSFSVGNKEPSRQDFIDNTTVKPKAEHLKDFELGYRHRNNKISTEATAYFMNYKDQLVLTGQINDVGDPIRQNVSKSYRAGIELQATATIWPKIQLAANLTLSQNKITEFTEVIPNYDGGSNVETVHNNTDISFSPNSIAGAVLSYQVAKNLNASIQSKYVGKQFLDNSSNNNRALDRYLVNDLIINYSPKIKELKAFEVRLLANNIFNTLYSSNGYTYSYIYGNQITENFVYPQAGTNFLIGLKVKI